ncbi:MAG TPA: hypothetical protein VM433_02040 [Mycobacteriales bacterium]|nr:hypothetical protein [Mycobacteriales bacterium]
MTPLVHRCLAVVLWLEALFVVALCVAVLTSPVAPDEQTAVALRLGAGVAAAVVVGLLVAAGLVLWRRHRTPPGRAGTTVLVIVAVGHFFEAASTLASLVSAVDQDGGALAGRLALSAATLVMGVLVLWAGVAPRPGVPR